MRPATKIGSGVGDDELCRANKIWGKYGGSGKFYMQMPLLATKIENLFLYPKRAFQLSGNFIFTP